MRAQTSGFIACAVGAALTVSAFGAEQPNIVLIVADDLGYPDICAYGCTSGRTPHIDTLAERGVKFTDGYVSAPICSPSRAGMLTGRYQQRFGHEFNAGGQARSHRMGLGTPASETLLPAYLKSAGYATGMSGKWHLGSVDALHPLNRGSTSSSGSCMAPTPISTANPGKTRCSRTPRVCGDGVPSIRSSAATRRCKRANT